MEKARQLSILCESSVALIIISATGRLYSFSSGDSMAKILSRYELEQADDLKTLDLEEKTLNYLSHKELLETIQWLALRLLFPPFPLIIEVVFLFCCLSMNIYAARLKKRKAIM
jgi:hypothetical protein